ncbi:hypothetical protein B0H11DRAFT_1679861, partial [Mycena galericulata]
EDGDAIQETKTEVKKAKAALREAETKLKKKEGALGVKERARLTKVGASKYYDVRMRCRALKHRLRDRLRARKFELDRVERSARHHRGRANEKKLGAHAEVAIKRRDPGIATLYKEYNKLCAQIRTMIQNRTAPRKVIAPQVIDPKKVWQLDVDDDIWQDVGLDDDDDDDGAAGSSEPPLWLSNESVRSGILAMLDVDRADEEDRELEKERRAMQVWFAEEWEVVNLALEEAASEGLRYGLHLRRERLLRLCATWQRHLPRSDDATVPAWGPTAAELWKVRLEGQTGGRGEDTYREGNGDDDGEDSSDSEVED